MPSFSLLPSAKIALGLVGWGQVVAAAPAAAAAGPAAAAAVAAVVAAAVVRLLKSTGLGYHSKATGPSSRQRQSTTPSNGTEKLRATQQRW